MLPLSIREHFFGFRQVYLKICNLDLGLFHSHEKVGKLLVDPVQVSFQRRNLVFALTFIVNRVRTGVGLRGSREEQPRKRQGKNCQDSRNNPNASA